MRKRLRYWLLARLNGVTRELLIELRDKWSLRDEKRIDTIFDLHSRLEAAEAIVTRQAVSDMRAVQGRSYAPPSSVPGISVREHIVISDAVLALPVGARNNA